MILLQIDPTPSWLTKAEDQGGAIIICAMFLWVLVHYMLPEWRQWRRDTAAERRAADDQVRTDRKEAEAAERKAYADRIDDLSRQMKAIRPDIAALKPLLQENTEVTKENTAAKTGDLPVNEGSK